MQLQIAKELESFFESLRPLRCERDKVPFGAVNSPEWGICKHFIENDRAKNHSRQLSEVTVLVQLTEFRFSSFRPEREWGLRCSLAENRARHITNRRQRRPCCGETPLRMENSALFGFDRVMHVARS